MEAQQAQILLEKINALWRSINATPARYRPSSAILCSAISGNCIMYSSISTRCSHCRQCRHRLNNSLSRRRHPRRLSTNACSRSPACPAPVQPEPPHKPVEIPPPAPQPQVVVPPPAPKPQPTPPAPPAPVRSAAAYEGLFNAKSSNDLSDKLSKQPIADLTKAFAINDKLLYANDLFGKDQNAFADNVRQLNSYGSFENARTHILQLAQQYHWMAEEHMETAQAFVQLVQRRYLA